jgi:hypothetical protein
VKTKERLHKIIDSLADEQADRALVVLGTLTELQGGPAAGQRMPTSIGVAASGRADISERVDELLAEGFGR